MLMFTVSDCLAILVWAIIAILILFLTLKTAFRQSRCKHDKGYTETRSCDAICRKCGKNLGFIQNLRDKEKKQ